MEPIGPSAMDYKRWRRHGEFASLPGRGRRRRRRWRRKRLRRLQWEREYDRQLLRLVTNKTDWRVRKKCLKNKNKKQKRHFQFWFFETNYSILRGLHGGKGIEIKCSCLSSTRNDETRPLLKRLLYFTWPFFTVHHSPLSFFWTFHLFLS